VLENDTVWGDARDIGEVPAALVERLEHYFRTYKAMVSDEMPVRIEQIYGREHALRVVAASMKDYEDGFGQ